MNLTDPLKYNQILVFVIPEKSYNFVLEDILKKLKNKKICYVSLNRPYSTVKQVFSELGFSPEEYFVIDAISKTAFEPKPQKNCFFVSSPNDLVDLSLVVSKVTSNKKIDTMVFDSLSTLMLYQKERNTSKFTHFITTKLRVNGVQGIFTVLEEDMHSTLVRDLSMFADNVLYPDDFVPKKQPRSHHPKKSIEINDLLKKVGK